MEILDANEAVLSNLEVLVLLKEMDQQQRQREKAARKAKTTVIKPPPSQATIMFEVRKALNKQPLKSLTPAGFASIMTELKRFPLTKSEKLQLVNLRPVGLVELHAIIDECPARLTDEQLQDLVRVIQTHWPVEAPAAAASAVKAEDAGEVAGGD